MLTFLCDFSKGQATPFIELQAQHAPPMRAQPRPRDGRAAGRVRCNQQQLRSRPRRYVDYYTIADAAWPVLVDPKCM